MNKDDDDDDDEDEDESHILSLGHHRMKSLVFLSLSFSCVFQTFSSQNVHLLPPLYDDWMADGDIAYDQTVGVPIRHKINESQNI